MAKDLKSFRVGECCWEINTVDLSNLGHVLIKMGGGSRGYVAFWDGGREVIDLDGNLGYLRSNVSDYSYVRSSPITPGTVIPFIKRDLVTSGVQDRRRKKFWSD